MRIELTLIAWKAIVLPLNYTRNDGAGRGTWTLTSSRTQDFKSCASTIPPLQQSGAPYRTWTCDPFIKSEMLYRWANEAIIFVVSYIGIAPISHHMGFTVKLIRHVAGLVGIEPTHGRIKIFCLTAWLQANNGGQSWIRTNETGVADLQSAAFGHFAICPKCYAFFTKHNDYFNKIIY